jgi:GT2 family glycosyltransferase
LSAKTESVAAVVVTYNRVELLKKCIQALKKQTKRVDEIIVVNNSSTDGTLDWLNTQNDITIITQENSGSAGGQHTGIKTAYKKGFDWIWCMDDDCFAKEDALESLLKSDYAEFYVRNSLVLDNKVSKRLAFGLYDFNKKKYFLETGGLSGEYFVGIPNFFNGALIHKYIVARVGFPHKELFIRGDEIEYAIRIQKNSYNCATIFSSIIYHNYEENILIANRFFSQKFLFIDRKKRYYHTRNLIIIHKLHKIFSLKTFIKMFFLDFCCIIIWQRKISLIKSLLKGIYDGIKYNTDKLIIG